MIRNIIRFKGYKKLNEKLKFKKKIKISILGVCFLMFNMRLNSQSPIYMNSDSLFRAGTPNVGRWWGVIFADFIYKAHADSNLRGTNNQYNGIPQNRNAFQIRRINLAYDYNISKKFVSELLLEVGDNLPAGNPQGTTTPNGDLLANNKLAFYIKIASLKWKDIWKGTDLVFGLTPTPTFSTQVAPVWNYRSIERTILNIRKYPSFDFGVKLTGFFDPKKKDFGYNFMIGNGTAARPENNSFKTFYGEVYGFFANKHIIVDLYVDYQRLNNSGVWGSQQSSSVKKIFVAYNSAATSKGMDPGQGFTIGCEYFISTLQNSLAAKKNASYAAATGSPVDYLSPIATGLTIFLHTDIIKNKLRYFARYDYYNPNNLVDNSKYVSYSFATNNFGENTYLGTGKATGDITYKQNFISSGLDFILFKNVHIMPNIWYFDYSSQINGILVDNQYKVAPDNFDLVYRLTVLYSFGR